MKLTVLIPVYNEEATLKHTLEKVTEAVSGSGFDVELILVDDGSTDASWTLLRELASKDAWRCRLRAVRFSRNFGKEAAILAGLQCSRGDAVVVMDADLQHPPTTIREMIELWSQGEYLVVEAVKRQRQRESLPRQFAARFFYRILMLGAGLDLRGSTDFKLLDRRAVDAYLAMPETDRFFRGLTAWIGLPTAQVEIEVPDRMAGNTKWRFGALLRLAKGSIVSFTALPLHIISWIGLAGFFLSVLLAAQTLWNTWFGVTEAGFPTVILLILFMGSLILISLGIIGEYLAELYREVKKRPSFVILEELQPPQTSSREE